LDFRYIEFNGEFWLRGKGPGPSSLDKKGGRKIPSMFHLCLIKDGTVFPLFCVRNPALVKTDTANFLDLKNENLNLKI
jgi:hypothetical protein